MYEELINTEEKDGFTIRFYACEETDSPKGHFASGDDKADEEIIKLIRDGKLTWFCAKVTASKNGIELASDYLGACCYLSAKEFLDGDGYYSDMRETVIKEAKETIAKLYAA